MFYFSFCPFSSFLSVTYLPFWFGENLLVCMVWLGFSVPSFTMETEGTRSWILLPRALTLEVVTLKPGTLGSIYSWGAYKSIPQGWRWPPNSSVLLKKLLYFVFFDLKELLRFFSVFQILSSASCWFCKFHKLCNNTFFSYFLQQKTLTPTVSQTP